MRKSIIFMLIAAIFATLLMTGCKKPDNVIVDVEPTNAGEASPAFTHSADDIPLPSSDTDEPKIESPTPEQTGGGVTPVPFLTDIPFVTDVPVTAVATAAATTAPAVTNTPSGGITVPTIAPTQPPAGQHDYGVFNNCCFIGNSVFEGLHNYGVIKNGTWYTKVGLNILTVYNTPASDGSVPIIDELNSGSYTGILLMFGQNECGWPDLNNFIRKYEQLLSDVWARQPQAKLFLMGITPVSKKVSDEGKNGVTNANINTINAGLEALAARTENAYYVSVPSQFYGADGALPADASGDGIHLNKAYMQIWADHICKVVSDVL